MQKGAVCLRYGRDLFLLTEQGGHPLRVGIHVRLGQLFLDLRKAALDLF
jgi:hypothetical protein